MCGSSIIKALDLTGKAAHQRKARTQLHCVTLLAASTPFLRDIDAALISGML